MMTFHLMMHLMMRGFLKLFLYFMTSHSLMTGLVIEV